MKILDAKFAGSDPLPGVFIFHSRLDTEKARAVARALEASNVNYYFDVNDEELQLADEQHDDVSDVTKTSSAIVELAQRLAAALDYQDFIPADRSLQDFTFY